MSEVAENIVGWKAVPGSPQEKFLRRREFEGLYGGAAGGMKTETLIWEPMGALLGTPNISAVFFRREYGMMEDAIARARELFLPLGGEYNESKHRFTFQNGSRYYFHHMQHEKDKLVYQGRKFERIMFDELTHFTESQYLYLFSRCRGNPNVRWSIRNATNPGGVGHGWVKRRFVDSLKPYDTGHFMRINGEDVRVNPDRKYARSRFWIPAKVWDNPYLRDTEYTANLMSMEELMRRMLLDGDWDVFAGQFFSMWRRAIHVVEPFRLPEHWNYFGGFDYGFRNPTAYVIVGVDPDGGAWVVREYYQDGRSVQFNAEQIKLLELSLGEIKVKARFADPSIWTRTPKETEAGTDDSIAAMYQRQGVTFVKANNQRVIGWAAVKEYLDWEDKSQYDGNMTSVRRPPRMRIFANCTNLIRTLPDAVYEEVEGRRVSSNSLLGEDLDTRGEDHLLDALRYALMHFYKSVVKQVRKNDWRQKLRDRRTAAQRKTIISLS